MRIKNLFPTLLAAVILFSGCNKNAVTLSFTSAKGEVPLLSNLSFRFNQSMTSDSLLNVWDSTDYVEFDPAIKGRFRWESPDELIFSPAQPLNPATTYKAKIKKSVLKFSKYDKVEKADDINFHTPDLSLDNSKITWIGESSTAAVPQLDLYFNYLVDPVALKEKLSIQVDGQKKDYQMITSSTDDHISIRINGIKTEDRDFETIVTIDKGIKPVNGANSVNDPISVNLSIPSPFVLNITSMEAQHDGTEGSIQFNTSQQVVSDAIKSFIKFKPEVSFSVEQTETGFSVRSDKFDREKSYEVTVLKGMRGRIGGQLKEDYSGSVAFGELEANIHFTNSKAVYLSGKGAKNIEVQITNAPKVKLVISKIYESNLLMAQRYGYEPTEKNPQYASYDDGG